MVKMRVMNSLNISKENFREVLSAGLLKAAEKCTVRECDETGKGNFVAYIDQKEVSFDVQLTIAANGEITRHQCDCDGKMPFCVHKAALLLNILGNNKTKKTPVVKPDKKTSSSALLLEGVRAEDLKAWLKNIFSKHKDLEVSFVNHFVNRDKVLSPAESRALTKSVIKAVAKNSKKIDQTQLKKILTLWEEAHEPVINQYLKDVSDRNSFLCLNAVIESCLEFNRSIKVSTVRIPKYVQDMLLKSAEAIVSVHDQALWDRATGFYLEYFTEYWNILQQNYLELLIALLEICGEDRRTGLLQKLFTQYKNVIHRNNLNGDQYTRMLFAVVEQYGLFPTYGKLFAPISYSSDYNKRLIQLFIDHKEYVIAETFALQQIGGDFIASEYNVPYLELLRQVYTRTNNEQKLVSVLSALVMETFDFGDYQYVFARMPEGEEKKKWRSKLLARAKQGYKYSSKGISFYFKIADAENNYKKMIEYIDGKAPYAIISQYFEKMLLTDKARALDALLNRYDDWGSSIADVENREAIQMLYETALKFFGKEDLLLIVNKKMAAGYWHRKNLFMDYLTEQVKNKL